MHWQAGVPVSQEGPASKSIKQPMRDVQEPLVSPVTAQACPPAACNCRAGSLPPSCQVAIPPPGQDDGLGAVLPILEDVIPFADVANPVLAQVGGRQHTCMWPQPPTAHLPGQGASGACSADGAPCYAHAPPPPHPTPANPANPANLRPSTPSP